MKEPIFSYIQDHRGRKIGCLAYENGIFGYSICHTNDQFSKKRARAIALGRARANREETNQFNLSLELGEIPTAGEWKKEALLRRAKEIKQWLSEPWANDQGTQEQR